MFGSFFSSPVPTILRLPFSGQVIGLSSSSSHDRRRARRASITTRSGDAAAGGDDGGEKEKGGGSNFPGSPASEGEIEDPEVIIARRNAEHRRMQARARGKPRGK